MYLAGVMIVGGSSLRIRATHRHISLFPSVESAPFHVFNLKSHFQKWNHPPKKLSFNSIAGNTNLRFSVAASASSPSLDAGTGSDYSDKLFGPRQKHKKKKKLAGIDQDELLDPIQLADPDSCFCEFNEIHVHHKVCEPESSTTNSQANKIGLPMILLHGFGASLFSWHKVMKPLACVTGSKVLAFDRPAFGLTSRTEPSRDKPLNPYSTIFSTLATLFFIESLTAEKAILVGHSAGAIIAVNAYFEAPERVAALILVAPAIIAPLMAPKARKNKSQISSTTVTKNPFIMLFSLFSKFYKFIVLGIMSMLRNLFNFVNSIYKKTLSAILLSGFGVMLVRILIDKFGISAVRSAYYDPNKVPDHVLHGYTKPLKAKGWDRALVEFTVALLADQDTRSNPSLTSRLEEISCPVLIITGDTDRLVPSWNSEKLSRALPGSFLEIIKNCGHMPHEEKSEEFISIVEKFLQGVFFRSSHDLRYNPGT
ncbi:2-hydroxy-6-oxo-6-phenylhexa-2,4-dienoate hydrolase [Impatiens glandulifera]|uniref:2-hydroxy-6-oxo-6-phenylhexa-2,4-dienoate hydrolase n=1 Tax=Impatiens glandulifera TaxID=253017 RepID=UPI001FB14C54|nr:2-hydroxy-6-oxo-6-phenylhexa-2,4-dienoate hydrolase [Impatiens glandulifera]